LLPLIFYSQPTLAREKEKLKKKKKQRKKEAVTVEERRNFKMALSKIAWTVAGWAGSAVIGELVITSFSYLLGLIRETSSFMVERELFG
jgi:hypothetical protein